jgi:hypothetical protein
MIVHLRSPQVAATRVDAHNYDKVANTLAGALADWNGQEWIAAPKVHALLCSHSSY